MGDTVTVLKLKETEHAYCCSTTNYYVDGYRNFGRCDYDTWGDFKDEWLDDGPNDLDDDYNHLFRFDIVENEDEPGVFELLLFFILQRKGIFRPVVVHRITEDDLSDIETFLRRRWQYLQYQWSEFSEETGANTCGAKMDLEE